MPASDPQWSAISSGWTVPSGQRRAVVLAAQAAGMTVDAWLSRVVAERLNAIGLARDGLGVDNGDEYGQRVVTHAAMVRGMAR
jgi:hypothetical protein